MKKRSLVSLLVSLLPFSLFAAGNEGSTVAKAGTNAEKTSGLGSIIGDTISSIWHSFIELNVKAWDFWKTAGVRFFRDNWIPVAGGIVLVIGIIILIKGILYKPRYILQDVPENAIPVPKKVKKVVNAQPEKVRSADDSLVDSVNPLNQPHHEADLYYSSPSDSQEAGINISDYEELNKKPEIDKEDLDFIRNLANDFNMKSN
ncbi:MAG: hypothetical protein J5785_04420 [Spirochaetales bacterium]|nr:hypothetical protein [Spirochaetales bacterium]